MNFLFYHLYLSKVETIEESFEAQDFDKAKSLYRQIKTDLILDVSGSASLIENLDKASDSVRKQIFEILNVLVMAFVVDEQRLFSAAETPSGVVSSRISRVIKNLGLNVEKELKFFGGVSDLIFELEHLTDLDLRAKLAETSPAQIIEKASVLEKNLKD